MNRKFDLRGTIGLYDLARLVIGGKCSYGYRRNARPSVGLVPELLSASVLQALQEAWATILPNLVPGHSA